MCAPAPSQVYTAFSALSDETATVAAGVATTLSRTFGATGLNSAEHRYAVRTGSTWGACSATLTGGAVTSYNGGALSITVNYASVGTQTLVVGLFALADCPTNPTGNPVRTGQVIVTVGGLRWCSFDLRGTEGLLRI